MPLDSHDKTQEVPGENQAMGTGMCISVTWNLQGGGDLKSRFASGVMDDGGCLTNKKPRVFYIR